MTMAPPHPTYQTMSFFNSGGVKYALCLMVRNANKKVSGALEPEKGSGSQEVGRSKKMK